MKDVAIEFSRHAVRRMRLYGIEEEDVVASIRAGFVDPGFASGGAALVNEDLSEKYGYPLKVVFSRDSDRIVVITTYPMKRERRP